MSINIMNFRTVKVEEHYTKLSQQQLLQLPIDQQIEKLIKQTRILPFNRIREIVTEKTEKLLLRELEKVAYCIRGLWIVRE